MGWEATRTGALQASGCGDRNVAPTRSRDARPRKDKSRRADDDSRTLEIGRTEKSADLTVASMA